MAHVAIRLLALTLTLALGGCPGSIVGMVKQSKVLGYYSGGPREGWNKGYTVSLPKNPPVAARPVPSPPSLPLPDPAWDAGL